MTATSAAREDGRLWVIALGLSLLANVAILGLAGFAAIKSHVFTKHVPVSIPVPSERVITIFPEIPAEEVAKAASSDPQFARTSPDQTAPPPEKKNFIGERDTQATSDRAPDATAPPLPSQAGIDRDDLETTESDYQDGKLTSENSAMPTPPAETTPAIQPSDPAVASQSPTGEKITDPGKDDLTSSPPPLEKLVEGPNPVDIAVPKAVTARDEIKPTPPKRQKDGSASTKPAELPKPPAATPVNDPAFAGYQRKSAIVGSISRTGRSAMNVANTPLGRYQAIISRAVELEWQRNCVRHRDFITPGFLTVRFFVETNGKVRTVQFVGRMETGEVQKGFTLNSIRDAEIPPMPAALKGDYSKQPLELIFSFYF